MYTACYILAALLSIWGGCLVARVIANRLEHGLFRRRARATGVDPAWTPPIKRSGWWTWVGMGVLGGAVIAGALTAQAVSQTTWSGWSRTGGSVELWAALAFATLGLGGGLAIVGLRFDPSRGRRRCPVCWYDMSATAGRLCPECGHDAPDERRLFATRRSQATVALAMVLLLSAPLATRVRSVLRYGWIGAVPTTLLIPLWSLAPDTFGDPVAVATAMSAPVSRLPGGLVDRVEHRDVWRWQAAWLERACNRTLARSEDAIELARALDAIYPAHRVAADDPTWGGMPRPLESRGGLSLKVVGQLRDPDPRVRGAAATLLPQLGGIAIQDAANPDVERIRASLLEVALGQDEYAGTCALQAIGQASMRGPELDRIEAAVHSPSLGRTRRWWMMNLLIRDGADPGGRLARALEDPDERMRSTLLETIGALSSNGPVRNMVLRAVESDTPAPAGAAALGLARLWNGSHTERDAILARARRDAASAGAMVPALEVLLRQGRLVGADMDSLLPALLDALGSPNSSEVEAALSCLARLDAAPLDRNDRTRQELSRVADDGRRLTSQRDAARAILRRLPPRTR